MATPTLYVEEQGCCPKAVFPPKSNQPTLERSKGLAVLPAVYHPCLVTFGVGAGTIRKKEREVGVAPTYFSLED